MRILIYLILFLLPTLAFSESYLCQYTKDGQILKVLFDRTGHSHFKRCIDDICEDQTYSVIFSDENFLIFGDVVSNKNKKPNVFQLIIIDKNLKVFKSYRISLLTENKNKETINGICSNN